MNRTTDINTLEKIEKVVEKQNQALQKYIETLEEEKKYSELLMESSLDLETGIDRRKEWDKQKIQYAIYILRTSTELLQNLKQLQLKSKELELKEQELISRIQQQISLIQLQKEKLDQKTKVTLESLKVARDIILILLETLQSLPNENILVINKKLELIDKINDNFEKITKIVLKYLEI